MLLIVTANLASWQNGRMRTVKQAFDDKIAFKRASNKCQISGVSFHENIALWLRRKNVYSVISSVVLKFHISNSVYPVENHQLLFRFQSFIKKFLSNAMSFNFLITNIFKGKMPRCLGFYRYFRKISKSRSKWSFLFRMNNNCYVSLSIEIWIFLEQSTINI